MTERTRPAGDDAPPRMPAECLAGTSGAWWDEFFADQARPIPFFVEWPDENLTEWFSRGLLSAGRVLELGCGLYERASLGGGLGHAQDQLRAMWDQPPFSLRVLRQMKNTSAREARFGEDFLWALLARREGPA